MNVYRPVWGDTSIDRLFDILCRDLVFAPSVDTGHWQAKRDVPMTQTRELLNVTFELPVPATSGAWAAWMKPNLPWAEDHFQERVSGKPLNPPPSHKDWPFNQAGNKDHMDEGVFSHSYPERLWPRFAGELGHAKAQTACDIGMKGIRYEYGDLGNLVDLLVVEPYTRQAYVPLWFPEDLRAAAIHRQRVPCTLGYHFILRGRKLHCFYPMRSLDLLRYFRDDAYMAGRLCQWVIEECRRMSGENSVWQEAEPGLMTMHAVSLHVFEDDVPGINHRLEKKNRVTV